MNEKDVVIDGIDVVEILQQARKIFIILGAVIIIMFLLMVAMQVQLSNRNVQLDRIETGASATQDAAETARDELVKAIEENRGTGERANEAILAIIQVRDLLCVLYPEPCEAAAP